MDEINTNPIVTPADDAANEPIITDATIEEMHPTSDEIELEKKPMTEAEVEAEVGGDEPVEEGGQPNFNEEDEEAEKQESIS